jgi:hypothetical protein
VLLSEFSDLPEVLSDSIENEGRLQARGEAFVQACEEGHFDPDRQGLR